MTNIQEYTNTEFGTIRTESEKKAGTVEGKVYDS